MIASIYAPSNAKKRDIAAERLLRCRPTFSSSLMVSVAVSNLDCTELFFVKPAVKVDDRYYLEVLLKKQMLPVMQWRREGVCRQGQTSVLSPPPSDQFYTIRVFFRISDMRCEPTLEVSCSPPFIPSHPLSPFHTSIFYPFPSPPLEVLLYTPTVTPL